MSPTSTEESIPLSLSTTNVHSETDHDSDSVDDDKYHPRNKRIAKRKRIFLMFLFLMSAVLAALGKEDDEHRNTMGRYLAVTAQNLPVIGHFMSIGYAVSGNQKEAQRAAARATFGAIGGLLESLNELIRFKSPKLTLSMYSKQATNARWMAAYSNSTLNELWIPGSHESATYSIPDSIVQAWAICQTYTIYQQLMTGIRYLDFRVITVKNEVYIAHRFQGGKFRIYLQEIRSFLLKYPTEIVIMRVDHNKDGGDCNHRIVNRLMNEILNQSIVRMHEFESEWPTISELTYHGTKGRVLLLSPGTAFDFKSLNAKQFSYKTSWDDYHCQYPSTWYANYKRFLTEIEKKEQYVTKQFIVMAGELTGEANVVVQSIIGQITRGIGKCIGSLFVQQQFIELRDMSLSCNYQLKRLLVKDMQQFASTRTMIVTHDYIDPQIVALILSLN